MLFFEVAEVEPQAAVRPPLQSLEALNSRLGGFSGFVYSCRIEYVLERQQRRRICKERLLCDMLQVQVRERTTLQELMTCSS